ncbi:hypothetical protein MLD38_013505 [Melastoma candidum]|uniref:Uncharacterized protein n=1 Tax=Melastoma candidum TaxID=119954 RepID=A0ACB9R9R1_9MYRT|nr:hypothetical protein MLD38_013505 [Melastoma candidum]
MKFETDDPDSTRRSDSLKHWFKSWEELRRDKLTASTFASAIGFWPRRRTQLWLEKIGYLKPFSGNDATWWNNVMEKKALERYKMITENEVLLPDFQVYGKFNSEDSWLAASPDGVVDTGVYGLSSGGVLEIKCPYYGGEKDKHEVWRRVPLYFIPQVQGLMEILDRDWMDFYAWSLKGSSLFRVFRSREYWDLLKIALSDFWWNHVQPAKEIYSRQVISDPLYELRAFRPGRKHALCRDIVCKSKSIVDDSELLFHESKNIVGREGGRKQWTRQRILVGS